MSDTTASMLYRGRLAPSPTGRLHLGHARTFWTAFSRAKAAHGTLVLRNEDLDLDRARPEFVAGFFEDLRWLGIKWTEGPDLGGPLGPYSQSQRLPLYQQTFERLYVGGFLFPCSCSRRDIAQAIQAPHALDDEPLYPGTCRPRYRSECPRPLTHVPSLTGAAARTAWRFRVPENQTIEFVDGRFGRQVFRPGRDFGDFVVWRPDQLPSYQLACVVDDQAMRITEVVRGADLLVSTARQLLLYQALGWTAPRFYHCPLVTNKQGIRLAKRDEAMSLKALRERGMTPDSLRAEWNLS